MMTQPSSKQSCNRNIDTNAERDEHLLREYALLEPLAADGYLQRTELQHARERARQELGCSERTLRRKLARLKARGPRALLRKRRADRGRAKTVATDLIVQVRSLIEENPLRSVPQALRLLSQDEVWQSKAKAVSVESVYRHLMKGGFDLRRVRRVTPETIKRSFAAAYANELWQGDSRHGISLPDPEHPGRRRQTKLILWIDDFSRYPLFGRYYFDETLPHLEETFRQAVLRYGLPQRLYCDNGTNYLAKHFTFLTHTLGVRKIHHPPYCAWCKGKVEAFNKTVKYEFQVEAARADFKTLEELNSAFEAWLDREYTRRLHGETGETPRERYLKCLAKSPAKRITDLGAFDRLFLWHDTRVVDKFHLISFEGNDYRVDGFRTGDRVEIRYNPFDLANIELWREGFFVGVAQAGKLHRRAVKEVPQEAPNKPTRTSQASVNYFMRLRQEMHTQQADGEATIRALHKLKNSKTQGTQS